MEGINCGKRNAEDRIGPPIRALEKVPEDHKKNQDASSVVETVISWTLRIGSLLRHSCQPILEDFCELTSEN